MKLYITRHGQVQEVETLPPEEAAKFPYGEKPLSELGREQAALLGKRLKEMGFKGRIISSPFMRTLETATIIAEIVGAKITPVPCLHEIFEFEEFAQKYRGLTIDEIKERFELVERDSYIPDNWWYNADGVPKSETIEEMYERVQKGILPVLKQFKGEEEILAVGHAASLDALLRLYNICDRAQARIVRKDQYCMYNCSLSMTDVDDDTVPVIYCDTAHIPYEKCGANYKYRETWDREFFESEYERDIAVPDGFDGIKGKKVLHIGDTMSKDYPYYRKLIETVKPDIIIHTGDLADEVKVGRIPEQEYEYRVKAECILKILSDSGVPVIIVPGNNDKADVIREFAPDARLCDRNELIEIFGQECRVGHEVRFMTFDRPWNLYGHGPTGDDWSLEQNIDGVNWRFNVYRDSYVYSLEERKYFRFPEPKDD